MAFPYREDFFQAETRAAFRHAPFSGISGQICHFNRGTHITDETYFAANLWPYIHGDLILVLKIYGTGRAACSYV